MSKTKPVSFYAGEDRRVVGRRDLRHFTAEQLKELDPEPVAKWPRNFDAFVVKVEEAYVNADLSEEWAVTYRLASQGGAPVVAEMRIHPRIPDEWDPVWPGALLGVRASVPKGGLTASMVRRATLGQHLASAQGIADWLHRDDPGWRKQLLRYGFSEMKQATRPKGRQGGRMGRPVKWYARLAAAYVDATQNGSRRPLADAAEVMHVGIAVAREGIHRARRDFGFLTPTQRGKQGGVLTPLGLDALKAGRRSDTTESVARRGSRRS